MNLLALALITLIPTLELRASIPIGIFGMRDQMGWPWVVAVCTIVNIFLGWAVYGVMVPLFAFFRRWAWFDRTIWPVVGRTRERLHPYVVRYGKMGVALFIGVPLPGSGVYTGAMGAYLLGVSRRAFFVANVLGVLIASSIVTGICLLILKGVLSEEGGLVRLFLHR